MARSTHPTQPDLLKVINGLAARIRDLETRPSPDLLPFFVAEDCLFFRGSGEPEDPYQLGVNIDPDENNQLECRLTGLFVGGGASVGWDAVVDGTAVASDPDRRLFRGIGEALSYLAGIGLVGCAVLVRPNPGPTIATRYLETANWTAPETVLLFGVPGGDTNSATTRPYWDHAGFSCTSTVFSWTLMNLDITFGAKQTGFSAGSTFYADDCTFNCQSMSAGRQVASTNYAHYKNCGLVRSATLGNFVHVSRMEIYTQGDTVALANNRFNGDILYNGVGDTFTLPASSENQNYLRIGVATNTKFASGSPGVSTISPASGGRHTIVSYADRVALSAPAGIRRLTVLGMYQRMTIGAPASGDTGHLIEASVVSNPLDITGPAAIKIATRGPVPVILRGNEICGTIASNNQATASGSGTWLSLIGCDRCNLMVTSTPSSAGMRPYSLDANCERNIVTFTGETLWSILGQDLGNNNSVVTT